MINECNFKNKCEDGYQCVLSIKTNTIKGGGLIQAFECVGEDNCVLFQLYKQHYLNSHFDEYVTDDDNEWIEEEK